MFRKAAWAGLLAAALGIALSLVFPARMGPLPGGMHTPIIALELARSPEEVETMFGPPGDPQRGAWRRAMDLGNWADFAFMLAYGLFFTLFSRALAETGSRVATRSWRVAALPALMDVLENVQLLAITRALGGDYGDALERLQLFTCLKWFGVAAVYASWISGMASRGVLGKIGAALAGLNVLATLVAFVARGLAAELMGLLSALTVMVAVVLCFHSQRAARPAGR